MNKTTISVLMAIIVTSIGSLVGSASIYAQAPSNFVFVNSATFGPGWYIQGSGTFVGWRVYGSYGTDATVVGGGIMQRYLAVGAQASCLGYPLDGAWRGVYNSADQSVGHIQHFQGGDIHWNPTLNQFIVICAPVS